MWCTIWCEHWSTAPVSTYTQIKGEKIVWKRSYIGGNDYGLVTAKGENDRNFCKTYLGFCMMQCGITLTYARSVSTSSNITFLSFSASVS